MKVLYIIPHGVSAESPSGAGAHIREIIAGLRNLGVNVVTLAPPPLVKEQLNKAGEGGIRRKWPLPDFIKSLARDIKTLIKSLLLAYRGKSVIRSEHPDIIYERAGYLSFTGWILGRLYRLPRVLEVNGILFKEFEQFGTRPFSLRISRLLEVVITRASDSVVTVSTELKRQLHQIGIPLSKMIVHQNGVSRTRKKIDPAVVEQLRSRLGLRGSVVCGFVGHILPWHGIDVLIRAVAKVNNISDENVKLLIVGPGRLLPELQELSLRLGLSDKVLFTGMVPYEQIPNFIGCIDICVLPQSNPGGSPIKLFDYGLVGKPIIAAMTPAILEVWKPGIHGIGIRNGNSEDLAAGILTYIESPHLRKVHGLNFQQKVLSEHTWDHIAERTYYLLRELLAKRTSSCSHFL